MKGKGGRNKKRRLLKRRGQPEGAKQAQTQATLMKYKMMLLERKLSQAMDEITVGGKAAKGGIRFGDYIVEINGDTTEGLLHSDAMMLIKTAGTTLSLKVTKEVPRGSGDLPAVFDAVDRGGDERPRPPPVPTAPPTHTTSVAVAPKTTVVAPRRPPSPEVKAQPSRIAPESGLDSGGSSTQQSPAFKRITIENRPTIIKPAANPVTPPTQQMQNITIDDGNVRKTSQRPQPPSNAPSTVTKTTMVVPKKEGPIAKPPPPSTASGGTTKVGGAGGEPGGQKLSDRQGVCEACHEPIRGPFASAMNKVWHPEHFVCSGCNKSMQNTTFVFEDEKIFCEECYQKNFAQVCHGCRKPILGPCISAVGLHWHQEHFTCSRCQADLSKGSGFNMENNMLFCADCFGSMYGATCFGCGRKIGGDELWVEALDHTWHPACFVCDGCRRPLEGTSFFNRLGKPVCKDCV